ncbi:MAG: hypothetical protein EP326_11455 [Deltaproteobacteria bacterium]|nr:MAG: hypothetical protein EP326_11455 [Deltaproteobacteria bacterium]TNF27722.1 MAG: hypothetical protein EP319_10805 [Deltaproteobacteria bacterium]
MIKLKESALKFDKFNALSDTCIIGGHLMKTLKSLGFLTLALVIAGCSTINKSHKNSGIGISITAPMRAKVDVDLTTKLTGYAYGGYLFNLLKVSGDGKFADGISYNGSEPGFFDALSKVEEVKSAAAYNAIRQSKADVLINPQYVVEESHWNPFWKTIKVKVTGWPGKVVSIKNEN